MESTPERHAASSEATPTRPSPDITDELLRALPPPEDAPRLVTALLTDQIHENYFNALSEGREITSPVARAIAYCLLAHGPSGASTTALEEFTARGEGSHNQLREEYLPLYHHPDMVAEGRLLLDVLGTHLLQREHPDTALAINRGSLTAYALDGGLSYTALDSRERAAVAFQLPMGLNAPDAESIVPFLKRNVEKYGDSFRAFLRLPGVDATMPGLISYFLRVRVAPELATSIIAGTAPVPVSGGDMPAWEGVEIGGQVHVFTR